VKYREKQEEGCRWVPERNKKVQEGRTKLKMECIRKKGRAKRD
jgi:hypothetical protein